MASTTPMLDQYHRAKRDHPDAILLFRLGDFYEMFFDDARVASRILGLALTARGRGTVNEAPMCGIPYHAADGYVSRLVRAGYRIAMCDQVEEASKARGLVRREVTRVISPGTITDPNTLDDRSNIYIVALALAGGVIGTAYADLSTGELRVAEAPEDRAKEALALQFAAFRPSEAVLPEGRGLEEWLPSPTDGSEPPPVTLAPEWSFAVETGRKTLTEHFGTEGLEGFGCEGMTSAVAAAGALMKHLAGTQKSALGHFTRLRPFLSDEHLVLDQTTLRTLEIVSSMRDAGREGTLLSAIDRTVTPLGARLLRTRLVAPSARIAEIRARHDAVGNFVDDQILRQECREALKGVRDMERILGRISIGTANARDLVALRESADVLPALLELRKGLGSDELRPKPDEDTLEDLRELLAAGIAEEPAADIHGGGIIRDGYSADLDELRSINRDGKAYIAGLETRERERTGISSLKVRHNRVFGYYIEISKSNLGLVPDDYERRQTLVGAERYITPELKRYEEKVLTAQDRISELEMEIFTAIRAKLAGQAGRIRSVCDLIARVDVHAALAEVAATESYVRPAMRESGAITVREGRHPVVESRAGERFVPNDLDVGGDGPRILIITGPNMGGKSTYLRQSAIISLMAQSGSFVPAAAAALPVIDRIFSRVGASDSLATGQSTFMVEMTETANILNNATSRSLVLLDEVGRGTATFDGLSLAWAIVEHLHDGEAPAPLTLFATHYHELTDVALTRKGVRNLTMAVQETADEVTFLRRVVEGAADRSYGIQVARLAGLPREVIARSREILANLETDEVGRDGMPRLARHRDTAAARNEQLGLFGGGVDPVFEELARAVRGLSPDALSPREALDAIYALKRLIGE
jgi:DNA mismatch repair protein MutS